MYYEITSEEEMTAEHFGEYRYLTKLGGIYDYGDEDHVGLGDYQYSFTVDVTNKNGEEKSFNVEFQPEERNNGMKAYEGYELDFAGNYGCDGDESFELLKFCDDDESILKELEEIATHAAKEEYLRLMDALKKGDIRKSKGY